MKKISLLIFIFTLGFTSFAEELKFLTGGKYVNGECRNGKYVNDQRVRKKRIWGKWVTEKYYNKILRPLKEFKVGKKYCLYGTKNWDEACQDAAFEYAFGENWREFKRVALEFIEAQKTEDTEKMMELWALPCGVTVSNGYHEDGTIKYRWPGADNEEELMNLLKREVLVFESDSKYLQELSYEKFLIEDIWEGKFYTVSLSKYLNIIFDFDSDTFEHNGTCIYKPKIVNFRY